MDHKTMLKIVSMAVVVLFFQGCAKVTPHPKDSTPPQVEIKVKGSNGQWVDQTAVNIIDEPVNVECLVSDAQGVRSVALDFDGGSADTCTTNSATTSGNFFVALPTAQSQTLQGDSSGQVLTALPLFATVAPPHCTVSGSQPPAGEGRPIGHVITAHCKGGNWSSSAQNKTAQAKLKITVH